MIFLDYAVLLCLFVTIIYCWKLNNKIIELKKGRKTLEILFSNFSQSLNKSEENLKDLKGSCMKISSEITQKLDQAKFVTEDLAFMIDKGNSLFNKFEKENKESLFLKKSPLTGDSLKSHQIQNSLEKQYAQNKPAKLSESKKSTIESLLAKIAAVKENQKNMEMFLDPREKKIDEEM